MRRSRLAALVAAGFIVAGLPALSSIRAEADLPVCTLDLSSHTTRDLDPATGATNLAGATRIMRFANLSDSHIIDDEADVVMTQNQTEVVLDPTIGNNSAQRLQEEFTDEVLNAMVRSLNACNGSDPLELMIATGDLTDNANLNEVRRYIDNLGGTSAHVSAYEKNCGYVTRDFRGNLKAGAPEVCPIPADVLAIPTGRDASDSQSPPPDGDLSQDRTWALRPLASAQQVANAAAASIANGSHHVAAGLPDSLACEQGVGCANEKLAIDHFAAFGNHDGYPRGTVTFQQPFQGGAVPWGRYFLENQREFINEYFETTGTPAGHGFNFVEPARFDNANDRDDGYYAFDAGADEAVRIIVLNTIADGVIDQLHQGGATGQATGGHVAGNEVTNTIALEQGVMDQAQLDWLEAELAVAANRPVLVFSHHPDRSFSENRNGQPATGVPAVEVNEALGAHGNVVAWIAGHTHANRIAPCAPGPSGCQVGSGSNASFPDVANGFWRVETASLVDYPQEGRIVELYGLAGGGYGLKLTQVRPDQNDPVANRSRALSIWEEDCSAAAFLGGPMSSGPYDQGRLEGFGERAANLVTGTSYCAGNVEGQGSDADPGPQGGPRDRNTVLLP